MTEPARTLPRLVVVSDTSRAEPSLLLSRFARIAALARPGSVLFILRDYELDLPSRFRLGQELLALAGRGQQRFGVADRADWARAWGCAALHLPASGLRARDARQYVGPGVLLSRGCHDLESSAEPELDALWLSPIFEPRKGRAALGIAAIERRARSTNARPALFALGGVTAENAAACMAAGAAGVAVIGAALAPNPEPLLAALAILRS